MSDAELVRVGAADGLPETGSTTESRVRSALRIAQKVYPRAVVRVGPGLGVTYAIRDARTITYHRGPDFQFWVLFPTARDCPTSAAFVLDRGGRIPVFAVFAT